MSEQNENLQAQDEQTAEPKKTKWVHPRNEDNSVKLRSIIDIVADLSKPLSDRVISQRQGAGGIMIGLLTNEKHYYNIINMQKEGVGFRMHHDIKIKACTLLQVYCEKQVLILRDSTLYGEIEMFGKRGNTFKAIGENNDDCVMSTLAMLNYVNSNYFYGNVDDVSIHKKPTILKTGDLDESDPDISAALSRMRTEDANKNNMRYVAGAIISPGFSGTTHSDAAHWRETNIPNQKNNQMFNPHANGNSFWHYNGY
jgi:hypothetical protein